MAEHRKSPRARSLATVRCAIYTRKSSEEGLEQVPVLPSEVEGRRGKEGGQAKTREAKLGCVFSQTRRDEQGFPLRDPESTTYVGAIEEATAFGVRIYTEAARRGATRALRLVVLGDGAPWIWGIAAEHFHQAIQIVDLYHARQRLCDLSKIVWGLDSAETQQWVRLHQELLDRGDIEALLDAMRQLPAGDKTARKARRTSIEYFRPIALIVLMQRLHEDDLAGHLLQSGDWHHLNLPAIAEEDQSIALGPEQTHDRKRSDVLHPGRESLPTLMRIKEEVGSLTFSAQYQQRPVPHEGNLIKREWLKYYDQLPERDTGWQIVQSWDVATTVNKSSDYSVCTTWAVHRQTCYLVEVWRGQRGYPGVKRAIVQRALAQRVNTILIEKAGPGLHLVQELRHNGDARVPAPIGIQPESDKLSRTEAQLTDFESGRVLLSRHAPWLGEFLNELLAFPNSRHDDQVDSVTQFLGWQRGRQRRHRRISTVAPILVLMEG